MERFDQLLGQGRQALDEGDFSLALKFFRQASAIASQQPVISATGQALNISADSLCIHSDTPNVMRFIKAIRQQFQSQGIHVS